MPLSPGPGEQYLIRQKVFKILGNAFHIYGEGGKLVGYCKQKAFKLREEMRFYTDESMSQELFSMQARQILDFGATYDIRLPGGEGLGSLRRKGLKSMLRDEWAVLAPEDEGGQQIGRIVEDSTGLAIARRVLGEYGAILPQKLHMEDASGRRIATYRTAFNPFIYKLGVGVEASDDRFDDLLILAAGCLLAAIEGRQAD